jgi:hypothetical protein
LCTAGPGVFGIGRLATALRGCLLLLQQLAAALVFKLASDVMLILAEEAEAVYNQQADQPDEQRHRDCDSQLVHSLSACVEDPLVEPDWSGVVGLLRGVEFLHAGSVARDELLRHRDTLRTPRAPAAPRRQPSCDALLLAPGCWLCHACSLKAQGQPARALLVQSIS